MHKPRNAHPLNAMPLNTVDLHTVNSADTTAALPNTSAQPCPAAPQPVGLPLFINGERNLVTLTAPDIAGCSLQQVLEQTLGELPTHAIAVALNDRIIARSCWDSTAVQAHDRIDCFQLVAGG